MATPPDTHETLVSLSLRFWQTRRISGVDRSAVGRREREMRDGMSVLRIIQCV